MPPYLSGSRFRKEGYGIDLSLLDDVELAAIARRATSEVDSFCAVPLTRSKFSFGGGVIKGEEHRWRIPVDTFDLGQRRMYLFGHPLKSIERFRIYVTNTQYVEIQASDLVINVTERYSEVVSLAITSSGLFNALIVPNVGLATPKTVVDYTYGWDFALKGEELSSSDQMTYWANDENWDKTIPAVVYKNDTIIDPATDHFAIDYRLGQVVFESPLLTSDVVSADFTVHLPTDIAKASGAVMAKMVAEANLAKKGMAGVSSLSMAEVKVTRESMPIPRSGARRHGYIDDSIANMLEPFTFRTVR